MANAPRRLTLPHPKHLTLESIRRLFSSAGATQLYLKELAANHDSKRQIYLSTTTDPFNIFPHQLRNPPPTAIPASRKKRKTTASRIFGDLNFHWLDLNGATERATHAKLILYPQYPEVRLSGFMRGVRSIPRAFMREKAGDTYPNRLLFLGVASGSRTLALLVVGDNELRDEVRRVAGYALEAGFNRLELTARRDSKHALIDTLKLICQKGWINPAMLRQSGRSDHVAENSGGMTLEAELGITANGNSDPDFLGWEVKQHRVSSLARAATGAITLMTPEPDGGFYGVHGVKAFVRKFGYPDTKHPDRLNFNSRHFVGVLIAKTGMTLDLLGYDVADPERFDLSGCVRLIKSDEVAASWSFTKLLAHWNKKHALAAYVPCEKRREPLAYRFGGLMHLGQGTDFTRLLRAFACGFVYYDPGIKLEDAAGAGRAKPRSQFRINAKHLSHLYRQWESVRLD